MQAYINTNNVRGAQLTIFNKDAEAQQSEILAFFKRHSGKEYMTWEIESILNMNHDSVKRSITNLTSQGYLERSEKAHKVGKFGKMVNTWTLC